MTYTIEQNRSVNSPKFRAVCTEHEDIWRSGWASKLRATTDGIQHDDAEHTTPEQRAQRAAAERIQRAGTRLMDTAHEAAKLRSAHMQAMRDRDPGLFEAARARRSADEEAQQALESYISAVSESA